MLVLTLLLTEHTSIGIKIFLPIKNHRLHAFEGFQFNLNDIEPIS
jgi:hypothetical protein